MERIKTVLIIMFMGLMAGEASADGETLLAIVASIAIVAIVAWCIVLAIELIYDDR